MRAILTCGGAAAFRSLGQLLDLAFGGVELAAAEAVQFLSALPERDRLVQAGVAALEALDDDLQLALGGLEGRRSPRLVHRAGEAAVGQLDVDALTASSEPDERTMPSRVRTIA